MFVARSEELSQLVSAMKRSNHAALVYGKRRVGKTRLIKEALQQQNKTAIYYECIKGTVKENVDAFVKVLLAEHVLPFASSFDTFQDVFAFLNSLPREFVVVIDEYLIVFRDLFQILPNIKGAVVVDVFFNFKVISRIVLCGPAFVDDSIRSVLLALINSNAHDARENFSVVLPCYEKRRLQLPGKDSNIDISGFVVQVIVALFELNIILPQLLIESERLNVVSKLTFEEYDLLG